MKKPKKPKENDLPGGMNERVDVVCRTLLQCMELNAFSKSEAVSAMASLIASILAQNQDDKSFYSVIKLMTAAFEGSKGLSK